MNISAADIDALPAAERVRLMETLWESLSKDATDPGLTPEWHRQVLDQRAAKLTAGEESVSNWSDAKSRLRSTLK